MSGAATTSAKVPRGRMPFVLAGLMLATGLAGPLGAETIGDIEAGAARFAEECATCHAIGAGAENGIGPHLNAIFDRGAGSVVEYDYSDAMIRAGEDGLAWDYEALDVYLTNPKSLVSRTKMNYDGLADAMARHDVIAYLRDFSARPQNIPEAAPTARAGEIVLAPEVLALQGDPEYGQYLSSECVACHRADGVDEGIPSITNWPAEDFVLAMHAYKERHRPHPVMQMMAGRLSNEEIAALAAYFQTIE